jgi:serine/threonine protein kinase
MYIKGSIKLIDFGLALKFEEDKECQTIRGTEGYMLAKILKGLSFSPKAADMWSLGVVLYNLLFIKMPTYTVSIINNQEVQLLKPPPERPLSPELKNILFGMLNEEK